MLNRAIELYRQGGMAELARGISDFFIFNPRVGCHVVKLYRPKTLEVEGTKIEFTIDNPEDIMRSRGHGEMGVLAEFKHELTEDAVVWDIGANVGTYSILAELEGAVAEAFEPGEDALRRLRANAELNGVDINIHEYALADMNGESRFTDSRRSGLKMLAKDGSGEVVRVRRGDDVSIKQPDIVKIDVEGVEVDVIQGMQKTLEGVDVCFVEYHSENLKKRSRHSWVQSE